MLQRLAVATVAVLLFSHSCFAQQSSSGPSDAAPTVVPEPPASKHVLGIIPNFRTIPEMKVYQPIDAKEKFHIASQDSFDRGTVALAALFAGQSQLSNGNRDFGQGVAGYSKYLATAWGDFVIGDYMTEGVFPSLLHQDPRYFRRGHGSTLSRMAYSAGQIFLTHGDSGHVQFNYSEILGNSTAVAISNSYYANNRTAADAGSKLGVQLGVDMASNIVKEFWPDLERKFARKHRSQ